MDLVTIFYHTDEFCKLFEKEMGNNTLTNGKNIRNRKCSLKLSEVMTIIIYYHYSGYKTCSDFYHKSFELKPAFPGLPSYNRFIELQQKAAIPLMIFSKIQTSNNHNGVFFIDSFSLAVSHNKRISNHKTFAGIAQRGKTSMGWFYGFKLHVVINGSGEIINFALTPGNVADNNQTLLEQLLKNIRGKVYGDKGYLLNEDFFKKLYLQGTHVVTRIKKNMKNRLMDYNDKCMLNHRGVVESSGAVFKEDLNVEHSRYRSVTSFLTNVFSAVIAYSFRENKPSIYKKTANLLPA